MGLGDSRTVFGWRSARPIWRPQSLWFRIPAVALGLCPWGVFSESYAGPGGKKGGFRSIIKKTQVHLSGVALMTSTMHACEVQ
jgi:hypothetical protein